jgi:hypothetical protein
MDKMDASMETGGTKGLGGSAAGEEGREKGAEEEREEDGDGDDSWMTAAERRDGETADEDSPMVGGFCSKIPS